MDMLVFIRSRCDCTLALQQLTQHMQLQHLHASGLQCTKYKSAANKTKHG